MTSDTNPILTEEDLTIIIENMDDYEGWSWQPEILQKLKSLKQQILTALEQYPKLKAENEELKRESDFSKVETKGLYELKTKLQQENNQLKQLKQKIVNRINSMQRADASCEQGLTSEGYAILGVLHYILEGDEK